MIDVVGLTYTYPHRTIPALVDVNWHAERGEFVLLTGSSGCGKSTYLRLLTGLVPHFTGGVVSGSAAVAGVEVVRSGPRALSKHVGFVAQDPESQAILDEVEAEIAFALENAAVPPGEMRVRVAEMLELLDLMPLRSRQIVTLSGGERQRVAIAAALVMRPDVLILDEPTSQLDPQSAESVLQSLVRVNRELGLTVILAEHRLERVIRYVDRLTYLEQGAIVADGPVRGVISQLPMVPPVIDLGRRLGWQPLPLTVKEAAPRAAALTLGAADLEDVETAAHEPVLEVERLSFAYGDKPALREVGFSLRAGEALALLGRNGSGKTTLLKCIVGLLRQSSGEVRLHGRSLRGREVADICREIAYLPQNPDDLLFAESVTAEMLTTLRNHGLQCSDEELRQHLERLGLAAVSATYPRDLSVGQRQRVALGAVTVTRPRVVLLDEPTRGLDYAAKSALVDIWRAWLADGIALLLVTHDVELAAMIADQILILSDGTVSNSGPAEVVLPGSAHFAPQMARLFPGTDCLTVEQVVSRIINTDNTGAK